MEQIAHIVVGEVLEGLGPDVLSDLQGAVDVMLAIQQHLRLDDRHQAAGLHSVEQGW